MTSNKLKPPIYVKFSSYLLLFSPLSIAYPALFESWLDNKSTEFFNHPYFIFIIGIALVNFTISHTIVFLKKASSKPATPFNIFVFFFTIFLILFQITLVIFLIIGIIYNYSHPLFEHILEGGITL